MSFYPENVPVPAGLRTDEFVLRMLSPIDVELDYDAVIASKESLRAYSDGRWPREGFTIEENLADLEEHERDFHARTGFTYTVMNPTETQCLGCVYLYPIDNILRLAEIDEADLATMRSTDANATFWARQDRHRDDLDKRLLAALISWLRNDFAFSNLWFTALAAEHRRVAVIREAGLNLIHTFPKGDTELLLFE